MEGQVTHFDVCQNPRRTEYDIWTEKRHSPQTYVKAYYLLKHPLLGLVFDRQRKKKISLFVYNFWASHDSGDGVYSRILSRETQQPDIRVAATHLKDMCILFRHLSREKPQPDMKTRHCLLSRETQARHVSAVLCFWTWPDGFIVWKQRKADIDSWKCLLNI